MSDNLDHQFKHDDEPAVVAVIAQVCRLMLKKTGIGLEKASEAAAAITAWMQKESVEPDAMSNIIYDENDDGVLRYEYISQNQPSNLWWVTLAQALAYATWRAATERGVQVPSEVSEVSEDDFNELLVAWNKLPQERTHFLDEALEAAALDVDPRRHSVTSLLCGT